jgi:hypothetical protein
MLAHFIVDGQERERRDVSEQWLANACANRENILLTDGNTYRISNVSYGGSGSDKHARVELVAPQFARGS